MVLPAVVVFLLPVALAVTGAYAASVAGRSWQFVAAVGGLALGVAIAAAAGRAFRKAGRDGS